MITAQFGGTCAVGDDPIKPGEQIEYIDDGWQHVKCPDPEALKPNEQVCPDCFLIHIAGRCDA